MKVFSKNNFKVFSPSALAKLTSFLLLLVFIGFNYLDLRLNITASVPKGVYRILDGQLGQGNKVEFCLEGEDAKLALERGYLKAGRCEAGIMPLVKTVVGLPEDKITILQEGIAVNGQLRPLSVIRHLDNKGRPMTSHLRAGVIPEGKALVLSEHEGGFDGRYFGLVDLKSLKKVEPVFVW